MLMDFMDNVTCRRKVIKEKGCNTPSRESVQYMKLYERRCVPSEMINL